MKRLQTWLAILLVLILLGAASFLWADGSVSGLKTMRNIGPDQYQIVLDCLGDNATGAIADKIINPPNLGKEGLYLYRVIIENNTAWDSVTDDSDVYIKDSGGTDLLNGQGVDQLDDDTRNYIRVNRKDPIIDPYLTLDVDNQATRAGRYIITIILAR